MKKKLMLLISTLLLGTSIYAATWTIGCNDASDSYGTYSWVSSTTNRDVAYQMAAHCVANGGSYTWGYQQTALEEFFEDVRDWRDALGW